jgi:hypothetical protein
MTDEPRPLLGLLELVESGGSIYGPAGSPKQVEKGLFASMQPNSASQSDAADPPGHTGGTGRKLQSLSSLLSRAKRRPGRPRVEHDLVVAEEFGLTVKQRSFAEAYVTLGGKSGVGSAAVRAAGYAAADADSRAAKLLKHSGILGYIKHLSRQRLQAGAAIGADTLVHLAENGRPRDAIKLKAATALLAHGGLAPVVQTENRTVVEHSVSQSVLNLAWARLEAAAGYSMGAPPTIDVTPAKRETR